MSRMEGEAQQKVEMESTTVRVQQSAEQHELFYTDKQTGKHHRLPPCTHYKSGKCLA